MAKSRSRNKPYGWREKAYIRRVAGQVPADVIAQQLNRTKAGVLQWANTHKIKLRVPHEIMIKHWRDYIPKQNLGDC